MIIDNNKKRLNFIVWPSACCGDGKYLWIAHGKVSAIIKYDLTDNTSECICVLSDEDFYKESSIASIINTEKGIYTIPQWGNHIHFYDMSSNCEMIVSFPSEIEYRNKMIFCNAYYYDKKIICIPANYSSIISINTINNETEELFDLNSFLLNNGFGQVAINCSFINEGVVYATINGSNKVLVYDIKVGQAQLISVGSNDNTYGTLVYIDGALYLSDINKKTVVKYNILDEKVLDVINVPLKSFKLSKLPSDKLLIDSVVDGKYLIYERNELEVHEPDYIDERCDESYSYSHGLIICDANDKYFYFDRFSNVLNSVDEDGNILPDGKLLKVDISYKDISIPTEKILDESSMLGLNWMIENLIFNNK